jgi:hypothetical protein
MSNRRFQPGLQHQARSDHSRVIAAAAYVLAPAVPNPRNIRPAMVQASRH